MTKREIIEAGRRVLEIEAGAVSALHSGVDIGVCPQCHRLIVVREVQAGS